MHCIYNAYGINQITGLDSNLHLLYIVSYMKYHISKTLYSLHNMKYHISKTSYIVNKLLTKCDPNLCIKNLLNKEYYFVYFKTQVVSKW